MNERVFLAIVSSHFINIPQCGLMRFSQPKPRGSSQGLGQTRKRLPSLMELITTEINNLQSKTAYSRFIRLHHLKATDSFSHWPRQSVRENMREKKN